MSSDTYCSLATGLCYTNRITEEIVFHPIPINPEKIYGAFITLYAVFLSLFLRGQNLHFD